MYERTFNYITESVSIKLNAVSVERLEILPAVPLESLSWVFTPPAS